LVFSSLTGQVINGYAEQSKAAKLRRLLWGLHEAKFASPVLRWLFFFLGLMSCAMVATGLIYWQKMRLPKPHTRKLSYYLVERLNIASIAGLILAIGGYFLANRLLPLNLNERAAMEVQVFLWLWFVAVVHGFLRKANLAWREQLIVAAVTYMAVFLVDILQDHRRIVDAVSQTNLPYLSFAAAMVVTSSVLIYTAIKLTNRDRELTMSNKKILEAL